MDFEPIDIRRLQQAELEIFDAFTAICRKHNLQYFLNAGTLLGAVRHQGFIPWDDDMDICMPRTDYERFLGYAQKELPSRLRPIWFRNQAREELPQFHCQIVNLSFPIIQRIAEQPRKTYAWIDVFPLDGMPQNCFIRKIHGLYLLYRRARIQLSMFERNVNVKKTGRPWHERLIIRLYRITGFGRHSDPFKMMDKLERALKRFPETKYPHWVNLMGAYKLKETFPKELYGRGTVLRFEGREASGPSDADTILKTLYGDYMTPVKPKNSDDHQLFLDLTRKGETDE